MRIFTALLLTGLASGPGFCASYGTAHEVNFDETNRAVQKKLDLLNKKLDLSGDQQARVRTALNDQDTKIDLLKKEIHDAKKKIVDDANGALMSILNPVQQEKYQKIKSDILEKID